jgi:tetratricopeptide (TPR) repeat protein
MAGTAVGTGEIVQQTPAGRRGEEARAFLVAILLFCATVALYQQVRNFGFIEDYDDGPYVTQNLHVKYGLSWDTVRWSATSFWACSWQPLSWLSHAADCQLYFLNSGRHHMTSVAIHALSAAILFWVLWRGTGYMGRSLVVAALVAVHPMNVESVAWIAERKNVLSMLFFVLALGSYQWYVRRPGVARYAIVMLLYACSLLSKAQIITFPFILLLWDYWPLERLAVRQNSGIEASGEGRIAKSEWRWLVIEKLPLFALTAAAAVITMKVSLATGAMQGARNSYPLPLRLENAIISYPRYLGKLFWPAHLSVIYPFPKTLFPVVEVVAASLFLAGVTWATFAVRHRARYPLVGWLWYLGVLVPMIGIVQVGSHPMADRFTYVPFIGLFILICWGLADLYASAVGRGRSASPVWPALAAGIAIALLAMVSYRQISYWKDSLTLWSHALAVTTANDDAEDKMGSLLVALGRENEAAVHFRAAVAINPEDPLINLHAGFAAQQDGDRPAAVRYYQRVLDLTQSDIATYSAIRFDALKNMGLAYRDLGDTARAQQCFADAVDLERRYRDKAQ